MMKILVIGNGFLAIPLIERLESEGNEVLVFSRTRSTRVQCQQVIGDIFQFDEFIKVLHWKPQVIIHTAWITTPGIYKNDISNFQYAEFTTNLAKFVTLSDIEHLIILGTCAEYGRQVGPSMAGSTKLSPSTLYAEQKVAAFHSVRKILQESDRRLTWARIFYPYGPNQDSKRLIPRLIDSLKRGESMALADTSSIYDWITTRDIASGISWILNHKLPMEIDVGTSFGHTNLEVKMILEELLEINHHESSLMPHNFGVNEVFVANKNSPLFASGWSPEDSLRSGLYWVLGQ
jgi:nucleoside-diphosphate-sugar epimerase